MKYLISFFTSETFFFLPGLLVAAYFYSKVSGKTAPYRADIETHRVIGSGRGFWYQLWIVFITPIMFLYNIVVDTVWFLTEIFHFAVFLFSTIFGWLKWIWFELLWPGISFIWQNLIYYFWHWPWQQIQLVFQNLSPVASSTYLLAGILGTGSALILIHIGRWFDYLLNNAIPIVMLASCALSTSLLAFGSGIISSMLRSNAKNGGWSTVRSHSQNGKKSALYLLTYATISLILVFLEWSFWRTGWIHQWGNIIGGLLSGPAIFMAMLSLLNFIILAFATSLGSHFMLDNSIDIRKNSFLFIKLSLRNLGSLFFTTPWTLINAIILSIIPVLIFVGGLKLTQNITNFVQNGQENNYRKFISLRKWTDTLNLQICSDSIFNEYLATIQEKEGRKQDFARQKNWGKQVTKMIGVKKFFLEFTPIKNLCNYDSSISQLKHKLETIQKDSSAIVDGIQKETDSLNVQKARAEIELQSIKIIYDRFKAKQTDSLLSLQWDSDSSLENKFKYASEDQFNEMLKDLSERLAGFSVGPEMLKRRIKILQTNSILTKREIAQTKKAKWMDTIGYLVMGIFNALLWGFLISMVWVAFVAVWYSIYMKDMSEFGEPFKLNVIWKEINAKNKNQPLMSILIILVFGTLVFNPVNMRFKLKDVNGNTDQTINRGIVDKDSIVIVNSSKEIEQSNEKVIIEPSKEYENILDTLNTQGQHNTEYSDY